MATTNYGVGSNETVKLWSSTLMHEVLKQTMMMKFAGNSQDSMVYIKDELSKSAGDRITYTLRMQLSGDGVKGDDSLEGNEERLTTYTDNIFIDQLRHAVRSSGKMSDQRVPFEVREEAMLGLADWLSGRMETAMFNQLAGKTDVTDTRYTGSNATTAATTNNIIYAGTGNTTETQVGSASASNYFKLEYIDTCVEKAKTLTPAIRPIKVNGQDKYVVFIHPYQYTDLRTKNTGTGQWVDIQKAALQGGDLTKNPIYTGAAGEYNNTIIHVSPYVPSAVTSGISNVYRAVFCGAQAGCLAWGRDNIGNKAVWNEKTFDFGNQLGVAGGLIWGFKKTVFNSSDFATVVIATSGAAH